ncbi:MAG: hypothetical protein WAQ25_01860 [Candidatus Saccharimonas sp.]
MNSKYIYVILGIIIVALSQILFANSDQTMFRLLLTIAGVAVASSASEIAKRFHNGGK